MKITAALVFQFEQACSYLMVIAVGWTSLHEFENQCSTLELSISFTQSVGKVYCMPPTAGGD